MLLDEMMAKIFAQHPYAHPIIGHKKELWQMSAQGLGDFASLDATGRRAVHVHLPTPDPRLLDTTLASFVESLGR